MTRLYIGLALLLGLTAGVWYYGSARYNAGVRDTTARFVKADKEGAKNVSDIARETLDRIGDDPDIDELLRRTGGLRD